MAKVELKGVCKAFGVTNVILGIDVKIADGEMVVIVGPSGCGKSTLLRMIAGLETVTEGEVRIGERRVNELEPRERDIAMVFQNYALYPHMSVYDNMAYGLRIRRLTKAQIDDAVRKAGAILELDGLLDRKPRQLSGGQRQRVAMGRAIVREPAVFLFDEPLSNLDAKLRVQMRLEIKKLHRTLGTTMIYVTHDQVEAMTLADRLIVMNKGVAEQVGAPIDVYDRPATTFVAGFIGSPAMDFLMARVDTDGASLALGCGGVVACPPAPAADAGRPVVVGVRPEHWIVNPQNATGVNAVAEVIEPLGADTIVHGLIGSSAPVAVRMPGHQRIQPGEVLAIGVEPRNVHLFDPETGRRLN